jgi:hypothetical protein
LAYRSQVISVVVREINMPKFGIVGENWVHELWTEISKLPLFDWDFEGSNLIQHLSNFVEPLSYVQTLALL